MIETIIPLAVIGGYIWMIGRTAKRYAVESTEKWIAETRTMSYPEMFLTEAKIAEHRREELGFGIAVGLIWPVWHWWRWWSRRTLASLPPSSEDLRLREKRIQELESQLLDKPYEPKRKDYR